MLAKNAMMRTLVTVFCSENKTPVLPKIICNSWQTQNHAQVLSEEVAAASRVESQVHQNHVRDCIEKTQAAIEKSFEDFTMSVPIPTTTKHLLEAFKGEESKARRGLDSLRCESDTLLAFAIILSPL